MAGPLANQRAEKFCQLIVAGETTSAAFAQAGYVPDSSNACHMRAKPHIEARIAELMQGAAKRAEITASRILEELAKIGFANPADLLRIEDDGTAIVDLSTLTRDQAASIAEVVTEHGQDGKPARTRLKLADKKSALDSLARSMGLYTDKVISGGPADFSQAQSPDDVATAMLQQAGVAEPSEQARDQVKVALAHLTERIQAIVAGESGAQGNG